MEAALIGNTLKISRAFDVIYAVDPGGTFRARRRSACSAAQTYQIRHPQHVAAPEEMTHNEKTVLARTNPTLRATSFFCRAAAHAWIDAIESKDYEAYLEIYALVPAPQLPEPISSTSYCPTRS